MRTLKTTLAGVALAGLLAAAPALAEDEASEEEAEETEEDSEPAHDFKRFDLPMKAKEAREAGLDADVVAAVIDATVEAELGPADAAHVLAITAPLVEEHGALDEYAELVAHKLGQGLRGEELAESLKEAHESPAAEAGAASSPKSKKPTKPIGKKPNFNNRKPLNPKPVRNGKLTRPGSKPKPRPSGGGGGGGGRGGGGGLTRPGGAR